MASIYVPNYLTDQESIAFNEEFESSDQYRAAFMNAAPDEIGEKNLMPNYGPEYGAAAQRHSMLNL